MKRRELEDMRADVDDYQSQLTNAAAVKDIGIWPDDNPLIDRLSKFITAVNVDTVGRFGRTA